MSFPSGINADHSHLGAATQGVTDRLGLLRNFEVNLKSLETPHDRALPPRINDNNGNGFYDHPEAGTGFTEDFHLPRNPSCSLRPATRSPASKNVSVEENEIFLSCTGSRRDADGVGSGSCSSAELTPTPKNSERCLTDLSRRQCLRVRGRSGRASPRTKSHEVPLFSASFCLDDKEALTRNRYNLCDSIIQAREGLDATNNAEDVELGMPSSIASTRNYLQENAPGSLASPLQAHSRSGRGFVKATVKIAEDNRVDGAVSPSSLSEFRQSRSLAGSHSPPLSEHLAAKLGGACGPLEGPFLSTVAQPGRPMATDGTVLKGWASTHVMLDEMLDNRERCQDVDTLIGSPDFYPTTEDLTCAVRRGSSAASPPPTDPLAMPDAEDHANATSHAISGFSHISTHLARSFNGVTRFLSMPTLSMPMLRYGANPCPVAHTEGPFLAKAGPLPMGGGPDDSGAQSGVLGMGDRPECVLQSSSTFKLGGSVIKREESPSRRSGFSLTWYGDLVQHGPDDVRLPSATLMTSLSYISSNNNSEGLTDQSLHLSASIASTPRMMSQSRQSSASLAVIEVPMRPSVAVWSGGRRFSSGYPPHRRDYGCSASSPKAPSLVSFAASPSPMSTCEELPDGATLREGHLHAFSTSTAASDLTAPRKRLTWGAAMGTVPPRPRYLSRSSCNGAACGSSGLPLSVPLRGADPDYRVPPPGPQFRRSAGAPRSLASRESVGVVREMEGSPITSSTSETIFDATALKWSPTSATSRDGSDSTTLRSSSRHVDHLDATSRIPRKSTARKPPMAVKEEKPRAKKGAGGGPGKKPKVGVDPPQGLTSTSASTPAPTPTPTPTPISTSGGVLAGTGPCPSKGEGRAPHRDRPSSLPEIDLPSLPPTPLAAASAQAEGPGRGRDAGGRSGRGALPVAAMRRKHSEIYTGGGGGPGAEAGALSPLANVPSSRDGAGGARLVARRLPCLATKGPPPQTARSPLTGVGKGTVARKEGLSLEKLTPCGSGSGSGRGNKKVEPTLPAQVKRERGPIEETPKTGPPPLTATAAAKNSENDTDDEWDEEDEEEDDEEDEDPDDESGSECASGEDNTEEETNSSDENEDEEDEDSVGSPSDDENSTSKGKGNNHSSGKGDASGRGRANRRKMCLTVKVSREGDRNVKMFSIFGDTSFLRFAEEVMWRFRYEELLDFDMYCIDAAGDHVDIDRRQDFEVLTQPYWARLNQMQDSQQNCSVENSHAAGPSKPLDSAIKARCPNKKSVSDEDSTDDGRSTETVIRLYVRDSCTYRRTYPQMQETSAAKTSLSPPFRWGAEEGNAALDSVGKMPKLKPSYIGEVLKPVVTRRRSVSDPAPPHARSKPYSRDSGEFTDPNHLPKVGHGVDVNLSVSSPHFSLTQKRRSFIESLRRVDLSSVEDYFRVCSKNQLQWTRMGVLGKGSFGTVYEGITTDGKLMAVKVQEVPMNDNTEEINAMQSEMNLMCSMAHKNIVTYYGCQVIEFEGGSRQMEIFLELCHGGTLAQMRRRFERAKKTFSISLVRSYTRQILEGLAYLHSCNVMHRDIKCDNVLISATGEAKLSDFGCSKRIGATSVVMGSADKKGSAAAHHTIVGSPLFMAPEVLQATGADGGSAQRGGYSMAADIWSVGCLVLELLGREPWIVSGRNVFQLMFYISQSKGLPNGVPPNCPSVLLDFFHMCFERNPAKRWTASQLLNHKWMTCPESELEEVPPDDTGK